MRFLPLLLLSFTLACISGVTGQQGDSDSEPPPRGSLDAAVIIVTVTPSPEQEDLAPPPEAEASEVEIAEVESHEIETATPEAEPTATAEPHGSLAQVIPTETPEPDPTETPEPEATETPKPTPTEAPSATPTAEATSAPSATPSASATIEPPVALNDAESSLFYAHNQARSQRNAGALRVDSTLTAIARERAQTMADNLQTNMANHYNPDGTNVFHMMDARGYSYGDAAENIHYAYGIAMSQYPDIAMNDFLASSSHNRNIHQPHFRKIGIGIVQASNGNIYSSVVFSD